jgi:Zn-dependent peptidase ImmA (M78 family)
LRFQLDPPAGRGRATMRALTVLIDDEPIWPMAGLKDAALETPVDDLLAHLAEFWKPLLLRQVYPAGLNPDRPSQLRAAAAERWESQPVEAADEEEAAVASFEEAHDLSRAIAGVFDLPSLWLFRVGERFVCESQGRQWYLPYGEVVAALAGLGDKAAEILAEGDRKWNGLIAMWHRRDEGEGVKLLSWSLGLDLAESEALVADGSLTAPRNFADAANDNDELRIAARMAGSLPLEQIRQVIAAARQFERTEAPRLVELGEVCRAEIAAQRKDGRPFVQGEAAARCVRDWLTVGPDEALDIQEAMASLGVRVVAEAIEPETLDGLAVWGSRHGPGVFLNLASVRATQAEPEEWGQDPAVRVTVAHELCHLVLDGSHSVSAVDVLKSRMPVAVEQRAKSFAGEVLLPSRTAGRWWHDAGAPTGREGLREVLVALERQFGVPRAVSTWKLQHGLWERGVNLTAQLDSLSRYR